MIQSKKELKKYLHVEEKIYHKKWYFLLPFFLTEQQVLYQHARFLRKAEYATNTGKFRRRWYLFRLLRIQTRYGISIPLNVLGEGFKMEHLGTVIINADCKVGKNCKIHPGVCIGGNKGKAPRIGDNVYLGPGAKLFGDIEIGDNIQVGANAVVTKSCNRSGAILVGVPAEDILNRKEGEP